MSKNIKYHYAKLFRDFFNSPIIKNIIKMPSGSECVLCYQRLILESANTDGWFYYCNLGESLLDELATMCDVAPQIMRMTISILERCALARYNNEGNLQILFLEDAIAVGSETESARRMRITRKNEKDKIVIGEELGSDGAHCAPIIDKDNIYNIYNNNINDAPEALIIDFYNINFKKNYKKTEKNMQTVAAALERYSAQTINDIITREARRQQQGEYGRFRPNISWLLGAALDECYQRMTSDPGYLSVQRDYDFDELENELIAK